MLSAQITEAQVHAVETGRPAGIWIERLRLGGGTGIAYGAAMEVYLCEVPPPYAGDFASSKVNVAVQNIGSPIMGVRTSPTGTTEDVQVVGGFMAIPAAEQSWIGSLKPYDIVQFAYRGLKYRLLPPPSTATPPVNVTLDARGYYQPPTGGPVDAVIQFEPVNDEEYIYNYAVSPRLKVSPSFRNLPPAATGGTWSTSYQVFRQPIKLAAAPIVLPTGAVIDLFHSGIGNTFFGTHYKDNPSGTQDLKFTQDAGAFGFTFTPSGALDKLYYVGKTEPITQPIYLLVGKSEKVAQENQNQTNFNAPPPFNFQPAYTPAEAREEQSEKHNFRDLENLWIAINPHTGLTTSAEMAEFSDTTINSGDPEIVRRQNAINASRQYATSAQSMGGR